ncbi:4-oxalocrotonate tautomerase DmpI [Cetobacterium sp.]|uniref:4-oxalocrotonate tautomerase DmpI n=1 Tax=Cetobacterium sp. TaxID=2071632 RepID=UPI003EE5A2E5
MPVIKIDLPKISKEQKKEIIKTVSKAISEITGIPEQFNTVIISENLDENIGIGSKTLEEVKESLNKK